MSWIGKRIASFGFAFKGIGILYRDTPNALIHLIFTVGVLIAGFLLHISVGEWIAVILCIGIVTAAEAFNSALESLADKVSPEKDPLIGKAKDLAAGAVLVAAVMAAIIGIIIFLPKIISLF